MITIVKLNTWWHALNFFITSKTPEFVVIKFENKYIWYIKDSIFLNVGITVLHICSLVYVLLFIASTYIIHLFCKIKTFLSQAIGGYTKNMEWSPADVSMVINDDHLPCGSGKEHTPLFLTAMYSLYQYSKHMYLFLLFNIWSLYRCRKFWYFLTNYHYLSAVFNSNLI